MLTVGRLAERYHLLPHEVAERGTSFDLMITDVLATYDKYQQSKQGNKLPDANVYGYTTEELMKIKDKGKNV